MPSFTTNLNLGKPNVAGDADAWGGYLNDNMDAIDALFKSDGTGTGSGFKVGTGQVLNAVGRSKLQDPVEIAGSWTGSSVDLATGRWFTTTVAANVTFGTPANIPASGQVAAFLTKITNGGAYTVTWWSGLKWAGGTEPALSVSGDDLLGFITPDGGSTFLGIVLGQAFA